MEPDIPHHHFTLWMVTPSRDLAGTRPVDHLKTDHAPLLRALESYRRPRAGWPLGVRGLLGPAAVAKTFEADRHGN